MATRRENDTLTTESEIQANAGEGLSGELNFEINSLFQEISHLEKTLPIMGGISLTSEEAEKWIKEILSDLKKASADRRYLLSLIMRLKATERHLANSDKVKVMIPDTMERRRVLILDLEGKDRERPRVVIEELDSKVFLPLSPTSQGRPLTLSSPSEGIRWP